MGAKILVQWTSIPVKLKILKLFIRELSNIAEGKEVTANGDNNDGEVTGTTQDGWESDDDDDDEGDWEDVERGGENDDPEVQDDILNRVNTEVDGLWEVADCRLSLLTF